MKIIIQLLLVFILFSCTAENKQHKLFTASNLTSFYITVDPAKDMVFTTPKGAAIKISKGTFNEAVELEIKEAYSMKDILLAGLTTQSNGQPLTSGGMIYINTRDQHDVKPNKPISVAIPTNFVDEDMQLFKGEEQADGNINWIEPDTLPATPQTMMLQEGKLLFQQNCRTCHGLNKQLTGPALRGFTERGPWRNRQNIYNWVHNPAAFMARDPYTLDLKEQYASVMQAFPALTNQQIDAMIAYLKNAQYDPNNDVDRIDWRGDSKTGESRHYSEGEDVDVAEKLCPDTTYFYPGQPNVSDSIPNVFDTIPFAPVDTTVFVDDDSSPVIAIDTAMIPDGVYQFKIEELGWYNIDALLKDIDNTVLCELSVQVKAKGVTIPADVQLFLPRQKILHRGTPQKEGWYVFENYPSGKMPLYLGAEAFILATGNQKEQLYVGTTSFRVQAAQQMTIELQPSTTEELLETIKKGKLEGISLDIIKQKMEVNYYPCDQVMPGKAQPGIK